MSDGLISLNEIEAAYRRVSRALYRAQEDALDFIADEIIKVLERDQMIVDAAFFILIFGQIENRINTLASGRLSRSEERTAIRGEGFLQRLRTALPGQERVSLREELEGWYGMLNRAAHGDRLASDYNIAGILARAVELEALLAE